MKKKRKERKEKKEKKESERMKEKRPIERLTLLLLFTIWRENKIGLNAKLTLNCNICLI